MAPGWIALALVAVVVLVGWVSWVLRMGRRSMAWPTTPGRVLVVWFDERHDDEDGDTFSPRVRYSYVVRGRTYEGGRLWYRMAPLRDHRESLHALRDIHKGDAIDVHYDPMQPERAVLFPGADVGSIFDLAGMFAGLAISIALRALRGIQ
jgi:hypothetical protein